MAEHPMKNVASDSNIEAGGNVHFGDINITYANETQKSKPGKRTVKTAVSVLLVLVLSITGKILFSPDNDKQANNKPEVIVSGALPARTEPALGKDKQPRAGKSLPPTQPDEPYQVGEWLSGIVTDLAGNALPDATVSAVGMDKNFVTGDDGGFRIFIDENFAGKTVQLRFSKPGYKPKTLPYFELPMTNIVTTLSPDTPEVQ